MIQHLFHKLLWFVTGGQSDFLWPLEAKLGGMNIAPLMELLIAVCLLGAGVFVGLTIRRALSRHWLRAATSLILAASMTTAAYAASSTLSALNAAVSISGSDLFYDVQTPGTGGVKVTAAQLLAYIGGNISGYVSISAGCGNTTGTGAVQVGTISSVLSPTLLTGSNPPVTTDYCGGLIRFSNGSNQVPTIAQAGSSGFPAGWFTTLCNINTGTQTITPAAGTIGGASSYVLTAGTAAAPNCIGIASDGSSDYNLITGSAVSGGVSASAPNTWTAVQTYTNSDFKLLGSSTGATTFTSGNSSASNFTLTFPAVTDTLATIGTAQTFTATQTFSSVLGTVTTDSTTSRTLATTDCGTTLRFTNSSAVTVTIPVTLALGCNIAITQAGTGKVSVNGTAVSAATLVTHVGSGTATGTSGQYAVIGIVIGSNAGGSAAIATLTGDGA